MFPTDHRTHWETFAKQDPYFAVLTDDRFRGSEIDDARLATFFRSGVLHVDRVLAETRLSNLQLSKVLDFGCGVGRTTLAFAARAQSVTGVDVSPTMLTLAKEHARAASISNVRWLTTEEFSGDAGEFDLVHCFLVLQHVPTRLGMEIFETLARRVRGGGTLVIQVPFWRQASWIRRLLRWARANVSGAGAIANILTGKSPASPYMQMNTYDLNRLTKALYAAGYSSLRLLQESEPGIEGAMILSQRHGAPLEAHRHRIL